MRMRGFVGDFRLQQEAVAFPRNGFDVKRLIGGIAKRLAEFIDSGIYVGVVVHVRIGGPVPPAQVPTGGGITRVLLEGPRNPINLSLALEAGPVPRNVFACL